MYDRQSTASNDPFWRGGVGHSSQHRLRHCQRPTFLVVAIAVAVAGALLALALLQSAEQAVRDTPPRRSNDASSWFEICRPPERPARLSDDWQVAYGSGIARPSGHSG